MSFGNKIPVLEEGRLVSIGLATYGMRVANNKRALSPPFVVLRFLLKTESFLFRHVKLNRTTIMGKEAEFLEACRDGNVIKVEHLLSSKNKKYIVPL